MSNILARSDVSGEESRQIRKFSGILSEIQKTENSGEKGRGGNLRGAVEGFEAKIKTTIRSNPRVLRWRIHTQTKSRIWKGGASV